MRLTVRGTSATTTDVFLDGQRVYHATRAEVVAEAGKVTRAAIEIVAVDPDLEIEDVDPTVLIAGRRFRLDPEDAVAFVGDLVYPVTEPALDRTLGGEERRDSIRSLLAPYEGRRVRITIEPLDARRPSRRP